MRRAIAIAVTIVVGASCIPWVRHQHFFSLLVVGTIVALFALMAYGVVRTLFTWLKRTSQKSESAGPVWMSPKLSRLLKLGLVFLALMLVVPHFIATNTDVYKLAVAAAHKSPQFTETLGSPVKEGWFSEGTLEWGNQARSEIVIPVHGRIRKGNLRALATKEGGSWRLHELSLELRGSDDRIDLLSNQASPR